MTIDEVIVANRLKTMEGEAMLAQVAVNKSELQLSKERAALEKNRAWLARLAVQISNEREALYWIRMQELLQTPCVFYKVAP